MREMLDLLQRCDDSDGIIGGLIHHSLGLLKKVGENHLDLGMKDRAKLFKLFLKEAAQTSPRGLV
ncbi:hypothetical protein [Paenibacillus sp. D9]|uniref:hypothetical protein n=1 Tax=Paenibacillus sp. D9 TaxID=665792 RepID=UPI001E287C63|nr:hypothetical protein [Paenibacillus sp. D9]